MLVSKICPVCKLGKPIIEWNRNKARYDGLSSRCKQCRKLCEKQSNAQYRINNQFTKKEIILNHYSSGKNYCSNCTYSDIRALQIDHINNDGHIHRKEVKGGHLYPWLIKNNFPEGFQVLCARCNAIKRIESNINKKPKNGYRYKHKFIVVAHYTFGEMCCSECRFQDIRGLQVDHIDGGGRLHIKSLGMEFYDWLIKNDFPEGFQVLCVNCNWIKRFTNQEFKNQYSVAAGDGVSI